MTILVGYRPQRSGRSALYLAAMLARSAGESDRRRHGRTPTVAHAVDGEGGRRVRVVGAGRGREGAGPGPRLRGRDDHRRRGHLPHRDGAFGLRRPARRPGRARRRRPRPRLVVGGGHGQVVVGSTADRLLHSSHVPVAVAPRGFHADPGSRVGRVTCSFSGVSGSFEVLLLTAQITERVGAALRIATFGVRGRTMYPPEVSIDVEDDVLAQWARQAVEAQAEALAELREKNVCPEPTTTEVGSGPSWTEAMDDLTWKSDDVLVVGSSSVGPIARVFLGQRANKIVRYSPVPVIVVPAAAVDA